MNIDELVCYSELVHAVLIQDIKDLIEQNNITICCTLREGNQCVDFMAKFGALSNVDLLIHPSHLDAIMSLLKINATRIVFTKD